VKVARPETRRIKRDINKKNIEATTEVDTEVIVAAEVVEVATTKEIMRIVKVVMLSTEISKYYVI